MAAPQVSPCVSRLQILEIAPAITFALLAAMAAGSGAASVFANCAPSCYIAAVALHAAWLRAVFLGRRALPSAICWLVSLYFCRAGLGGSLSLALVLEGVPLVLAVSQAPETSWGDRLARWRRARSQISIQLRLADGILPWLRRAVAQCFYGRAETTVSFDYQRFLAGMATAERSVAARLSTSAMPEVLNQHVATRAAALQSHAAALAVDCVMRLEQEALSAAAECRDICDHLDAVSTERRDQIAAECESLLLELVRPTHPALSNHPL